MRAADLGPGLAGLLLVAVSGVTACGPSEPPPSVILVSIDTLRADHVGLYGYERDTTPFLDRFAAEATVYERAFTVAPWTLIAHMTMLTGLFPAQHGVVSGELLLAPSIPLLAERLAGAGYQTFGLYYSSWIHERFGFHRGFDVWRDHGSVEEAVANLKEELGQRDGTRPYYLFLHLFDVHNGPMETGDQMIYPSPPPFEEMFMPGASERLPDIPPDELWTSENRLTPDEVAALVALYDGGIRHVDARLEEAFAWLEAQGLLENTLVIFTSDHGESLAQRGRLTGHGELAQEGLHIPLVVRHPRGLRAGERIPETVHLGDIVPTVLALAGLPRDRDLPGRPLFGELPADRVVTGQHMPTAAVPSEFVVQWPRKVIRGKGVGSVEFDLERDPAELTLQRAPDAAFEELLRAAFPQDRKFPMPSVLDDLPPEQQAALNALGYGGGEE